MKKFVRAALKQRDLRDSVALERRIKAIVGDQGLPLVDVGAAGEIQARWHKLRHLLDYVGFEPDPRSHSQLLTEVQPCQSYRIEPTALGSEVGIKELTLCRKPMVSSLLTPNTDWLTRFPDVDRFDLIARQAVQTIPLDNIGLPAWFFMKMDTQGYELEILKGATRSLQTCVGLEVEIWFQQNYLDQPMFGDVTRYLERHGFEFVDFCRLERWERHRHAGFGQLVWGDALYLRSPEWICSQPFDEAMIRNYVAVCTLYTRFDLIQQVLADSGWKPDSTILSSLRDLQTSYESSLRSANRWTRLMRVLHSRPHAHFLT